MRTALLLGGCYAGWVFSWLVFLIGAAATAGKSVSGGERGVLVVVVGTLLGLIASTVIVAFGLGRVGEVSTGARVGITIGYVAVTLVSMVVLLGITLVVFNR